MRRYHHNSFECQTMDEIDLVASKDGAYADLEDTQKNKRFSEHASDGMGYVKKKRCAHVSSKRCRTEGCRKQPSFGVAGTKTREYCAQHAPDGMVNVSSIRKCRTEGCGKYPSFGAAGTKRVEYCAQHAPDGMVNVSNKKCRTEGCSKRSTIGVAGTKTVEYCAQHAPDGMVNVCSKKCRTEGCSKKPSNTRTLRPTRA